uniref:Uncharacterized protein n=1 Tax=Tobacco rattle virus TaxID=12295 RepID=W0NPL4_9VIRU|nr:hypothetical protein [Tobacco rattle virus]
MYLDRVYNRKPIGVVAELLFAGTHNLIDTQLDSVSLRFQGDSVYLLNSTELEVELNNSGLSWFLGETGSYHFDDWPWPSPSSKGNLFVLLTPKGSGFWEKARVTASFSN